MTGENRPRIGITTDYDEATEKFILRANYAAAIARSGGLPILLPMAHEGIEDYVSLCHGILFSGGGFTLDPRLWGDHEGTERYGLGLNPKRSAFEIALLEIALLESALKRPIPILGICAGAQLINVVCGGSLKTSDTTQAPTHRGTDPKKPEHAIRIIPGTMLSTLLTEEEKKKATWGVNTSHRQAIDRLGKGLVVCGEADDGISEAIELCGHPFCLGIQWHPEYRSSPRLDDRIFTAFIEAAQRYGQAEGIEATNIRRRYAGQ